MVGQTRNRITVPGEIETKSLSVQDQAKALKRAAHTYRHSALPFSYAFAHAYLIKTKETKLLAFSRLSYDIRFFLPSNCDDSLFFTSWKKVEDMYCAVPLWLFKAPF